MTTQPSKTCLITGASRRIGAQIAKTLHDAGFNIIVHYHHSQTEAKAIADTMNEQRNGSAHIISANLQHINEIDALAKQALEQWGRIDALINNASVFYPTKLQSLKEEQWNDIINTNLKAPLFLAQRLTSALKKQNGCIINILDIHGERPLKDHSIYCASKAGLSMLTQSLARELAPDIRCNGIAPGAIMWPENDNAKQRDYIISRTAMKRAGTPEDIADAVLFLIEKASYITGQTLTVDGGRTLSN